MRARRPCSSGWPTVLPSDILVEKDGEEINGKSIMGLMLLAAGCGSRLKVTVTGGDANDMIKALEELIARKFDEE